MFYTLSLDIKVFTLHSCMRLIGMSSSCFETLFKLVCSFCSAPLLLQMKADELACD